LPGVIKSGGKTRRAAKMVILNAEHPDIVDFINCKVEEEKKAWALIDAGYDGSFTGTRTRRSSSRTRTTASASPTTSCARCSTDGEWTTEGGARRCADGDLQGARPDAQIAEGTWVCGDPGMQFDTTGQRRGTPARRRLGSTRATRAPSTCSWTTRRATWRRST
jgi:ribonucleoside-diphosphate reductase alpha chain